MATRKPLFINNINNVNTLYRVGPKDMMNSQKIIAGNQVTYGDPLLFKLVHSAINKNIKGGWRALSILQKTLFKDTVVAHEFDGIKPVTLYAPIFRPESSQPRMSFDCYDNFVASDMVKLLDARKIIKPIWLVDAGADIGMVSAQMIRQVKGLEQIYAFEPNETVRPFLKAMLESTDINHEVFDAAVGKHSTRGKLVSPSIDPSEHARYFQPAEDGPIRMVSIDTLPSPIDKTVILKIDVEGAEHDVILGARGFLEAADNFIVNYEAHPKVIARTGETPDMIFTLLNSIRPCTLYLAGNPDLQFDMGKSITSQIPNFESSNHNLICSSIN